MIIIDVQDIMKPVRMAYRKKYGRLIEPDVETWINGFVDGLNKIVAKKQLRFLGIIVDVDMDGLAFEKSDKKWVYTVVHGLEFIRQKGTAKKKMEELGNLHAVCYFWNLSRMHPYYFIAHELLDKEDVVSVDIVKKYESETGKKAKVAGKETNAFKEWKTKMGIGIV